MALWQLRRTALPWQWSDEQRRDAIRHLALLLLLGNVALILFFYADSPNSAHAPQSNYRYLIGILISLPAIISPLWIGTMTKIRELGLFNVARIAFLALIVLLLCIGTISVFNSIPTAQTAYQQEETFIRDLQRLGIKDMYSDYVTCNRTIFQSNEQISCASVNDQDQPVDNRYPPYTSLVQADPHAAYVFSTGSSQATAFTQKAARYRHLTIDGYEIYILKSA